MLAEFDGQWQRMLELQELGQEQQLKDSYDRKFGLSQY